MQINKVNPGLETFNRYYADDKTAYLFVEYLKSVAPVYAPHKKGESSYIFRQVTEVKEVVFEYNRTIQSIKKYFLPPRETLLSFNTETNDFSKLKITPEKRIFFGVHSYDMQSVRCLDYSFYRGNPESNYINRRDKTIFIGIDYKPDEFHFSKSVGIEIEQTIGFSLFFNRVENGFIIFEIDETGKELLHNFGKVVPVNDKPFQRKEKTFTAKFKYHYNRLPQVFEHIYKSGVWNEIAEKCVGCGTCNLLCSTCYCFDVRDEVELDGKTGCRERVWDGCMLNNFAEVAGGENFRESLAARTRHRVYRKFKYLTDQSGLMHCVGCGRCSKYCPAGIKMTDIINRLIEDFEYQQEKQTI